MEIEYKKRHRQLKVKLLDETVRTFMIDESATVAALTEHVGYKMGIKNPEEFSFKIVRCPKTTSSGTLDPAAQPGLCRAGTIPRTGCTPT